MSRVDELSDSYVAAFAALDPCMASVLGLRGHDAHLTDLSPDGFTARAELDRRTRRDLAALPIATDADRRAARVLGEHLASAVELADAGVPSTDLNSLDGPVTRLRQAIELLDQGPATPWPDVAARLAALPDALDGLRATLDRSRAHGEVCARRQVLISANQCEQTTGYLDGLPAVYGDGPLRGELDRDVARANAAFTGFARFLREDLAPDAPAHDALGRDRYLLGARHFWGTTPDLLDTYAWGWQELDRLRTEMAADAARIAPDSSLRAVIEALDADPRYRSTGPENFRAWLQDLADRAIADLDGVHFDLPAPLRRVECRIPPTRSGGIYYLPPSEDLTRPGQVWWTMSDERMPTWTVPATMYHESVPGHHLQQGMTVCNAERLNRFQRAATEWGHSGHVEGWGLYAERLMDELGYYADPAHRFGMLANGQLLRAARVVLDIGLHLRLPIPDGVGFHDGARWDRELGVAFLRDYCMIDDAFFVDFEIDRYLGRPGQAASYKLGERAWLAARADARRRAGADFDLKAFHRTALNLGTMGLDAFSDELARLPDVAFTA